MKYKKLFALLATTVALAVGAFAQHDHKHENKHDHKDEKKTAGPNGGRMITAVSPAAEFWINADRKVQIAFLGENGKPVAPSGQTVSVTTGTRSSPTKLELVRTGEVLVSTKPVPQGDNLPVVVQITERPGAKATVERFTLNMTKCPECGYLEYACTCDHDH
jgi:hypothetical protein